MYYALEGNLIEKKPMNIILKDNGIFYDIRVSLRTFDLLKNKSRAKIYTHLIIKDDNLHLYGFWDLRERELFLLLIQVNGVSTMTAQTLLSSLSIQDMRAAILEDQPPILQQAKGIGLKTAKRIILDLKDKMQKLSSKDDFISLSQSSHKNEALAALIKLGIDKKTATKNIQSVFKKYGESLSLEDIIKYALRT